MLLDLLGQLVRLAQLALQLLKVQQDQLVRLAQLVQRPLLQVLQAQQEPLALQVLVLQAQQVLRALLERQELQAQLVQQELQVQPQQSLDQLEQQVLLGQQVPQDLQALQVRKAIKAVFSTPLALQLLWLTLVRESFGLITPPLAQLQQLLLTTSLMKEQM
jgi:hypothetical protein